MEERGKGLSIGLRIKRGTRGRILARDVVRNVRRGRVDERGHGCQRAVDREEPPRVRERISGKIYAWGGLSRLERDQRGKVVLVLIRRPHSRGKIDLDLPTRVMCRSACSEKTFVEDGTYQITRAEHVVLSTGVSIVNRAALAE